MKKTTFMLFVLVAALGALAVFTAVFAQGGSECEQDPYCIVLPGDAQSPYTAPGDISLFGIKAGQELITYTPPGESTHELGYCWNVSISGPTVTWSRNEVSSTCQDASHYEITWEENPTNTPTDPPTPTNTATDPETTPTSTATDPTSTATQGPSPTATGTSTEGPTPTSTQTPPGTTPTSTYTSTQEEETATLQSTQTDEPAGGSGPGGSVLLAAAVITVILVIAIGGVVVFKFV